MAYKFIWFYKKSLSVIDICRQGGGEYGNVDNGHNFQTRLKAKRMIGERHSWCMALLVPDNEKFRFPPSLNMFDQLKCPPGQNHK